MDTTITTLEMCAGYGGIGLGLKKIFGERLRTIAYCELEGYAQANIISKMEKGLLDAAPIWNDLKTFPYESFHGLVDILIAGYPCQPFSAAGKRAGKDDPRHLWPWIADGIRLLQPRMCFLENVEGHISLGLSTVISDLEELGYKVSWGIFSASEVGAPHQRKRVFILAYDKSKTSRGLPMRKETQYSKSGFGCEAGIGAWPSRPGEPQHGWEPPRVVGGLAHAHGCGGEEPEHQQANLPSEPSGGNAEAMGDTKDKRKLNEAEQNISKAGALPYRASEGAGEVLADTSIVRCDGRPNGISGRIWEPGEVSEDAAGCGGEGNGMRQTQPPLGRDADGPAGGLGYAELQVACDNRTDELRLLGNGVVPATAERAFVTLINQLNT